MREQGIRRCQKGGEAQANDLGKGFGQPQSGPSGEQAPQAQGLWQVSFFQKLLKICETRKKKLMDLKYKEKSIKLRVIHLMRHL